MKMHLTKPSAAQGAWLIAGRSAAGAVLLAITVSACTGGGSSVPTIFTPTAPASGHASVSGSRTPSPAGGASSTRTAGASTSPKAHPSSAGSSHASASASSKPPATTAPSSAPATHATAPATHATAPVTHTSAPVAPLYPTAAPETGGGGTEGLQDGLLFGLGGLAVFAGLGSLAYRRRLARKFGTGQRTPQTPADREPADH
jgi:hypothetical protein